MPLTFSIILNSKPKRNKKAAFVQVFHLVSTIKRKWAKVWTKVWICKVCNFRFLLAPLQFLFTLQNSKWIGEEKVAWCWNFSWLILAQGYSIPNMRKLLWRIYIEKLCSKTLLHCFPLQRWNGFLPDIDLD